MTAGAIVLMVARWRMVFAPARYVLVAALIGAAIGAAPAAAQSRREPSLAGDPVSPAELQRLFDAYALVQAQDALRLDEAQFARFLPRLRALQEVRRRALADRMRILQDLRRLVPRDGGERGRPDGRLDEKLKELRELEARSMDEIRRAADDLDAVLDVEQRARLRLFDEQMDRRKLELLMRARQGARARNRANRP
ncbi:MAG: hypothetical protein AB7O32_07100 [Vicinamibacterales bacterium]